MSYAKMMKWNRHRPKGTRQPVLMHTDSGFWPSKAFIDKWIAYAESMEKQGLKYVSCEEYYNSQLNKF